MANNLIVKHNKVIESKYNMTNTEAKVIAKLTCMINKADKDFKKHTFRSRDLLEELGLGENNYVALKDSISKLITREIRIHQSNNKELVTTFLSSCVYDNANSTVTLSYDPELKPYFLQLKKNFTKYYLTNVLELKSFYSIRIYELLKQYERIRERRIEIVDLREILGVKNKYKLYSDFKRRILLYAKAEINEKTDLEVDFEEIKTGRKVTEIKFIIKKKKITPEEIEFKGYQEQEYSPQVLELFKLLPQIEQVESNKRELAKLLKKHSFRYLKADLDYAKDSNPNNFMGFVKSSCQNNHYASVELEKKEKKKELAKKKKEKEQRRKEMEDKIEKKARVKAKEKYELLAASELERYDQEYKRVAEIMPESIRPSKESYIIGVLENEFREELRDLLFS